MLRRSAVLLLILAAVSGAAAGKARAYEPPPDACRTVLPHATLSLGAGVPSVEAVGDFGYWAGPCGRFVVDISVPTTSSGGPGYSTAFAFFGGFPYVTQPVTSQYDCRGKALLSVYRKSALGGGFTYLGDGVSLLQWTENPGPFAPNCSLVHDYALPAFSPPTSFPVVYRIASKAWYKGPWSASYPLPVRVTAAHLQIPG